MAPCSSLSSFFICSVLRTLVSSSPLNVFSLCSILWSNAGGKTLHLFLRCVHVRVHLPLFPLSLLCLSYFFLEDYFLLSNPIFTFSGSIQCFVQVYVLCLFLQKRVKEYVCGKVLPSLTVILSCLSRILREYLGEKEVQLSLTFDAVDEADLANYTCYVENHIGRRSGSAILQKKGRLQSPYLSFPSSALKETLIG